jgi:hypothetical protein
MRARVPTTGVMLAIALASTMSARQVWPGLQANWKDLESWSRPSDVARVSELGLGLQLAGPAGTVPLAFLGRLSVRDPRVPPNGVQIQIGVGFFNNPNLLRKTVLTLVADAKTDRQAVYDLGARLIVDDPAPGGIIQSGLATMTAAEFSRLVQADAISGDVLGFEVAFRADQVRALRAFAERLQFTVPR